MGIYKRQDPKVRSKEASLGLRTFVEHEVDRSHTPFLGLVMRVANDDNKRDIIFRV